MILFLSTTYVYSAQVTLAWNPNGESDLAGYKIYYGNSSRNYGSNVDVGNQTSYTISDLVDGNAYYFAATAYDFFGNESAYSEEAIYDTTPPAISSVNINSPTQVNVVFSKPVEESSSTDVLNYSIDNAITVFTASLGSDLKTVTLTTSELTDGVTYILTVNKIMDLASPPNMIAPNTTASFGSSSGCPDNDGDGWCIEDGDCDDTDPNTYPGATEFCDGIDNNCDGVIDEGCSGGYTDNDGDGWSVEDGDCDDNDRHVYPGHQDKKGRWGRDGVDNDCNGIIDG